jgi:hypothetical protein
MDRPLAAPGASLRERRGVEVERSEDGRAVDGVVRRERRRAEVGGRVEEVAQERRRAGEGGDAGRAEAPAAAGERGANEVGGVFETEEDDVEVLVPEHGDRRRLPFLLRRQHGERGGGGGTCVLGLAALAESAFAASHGRSRGGGTQREGCGGAIGGGVLEGLRQSRVTAGPSHRPVRV